MIRKYEFILKSLALFLILGGLLAMLVAWQLLLVSNIHSRTVLFLEMGGVAVCLAGYLLRQRFKAGEKEAEGQNGADQSSNDN